MGIKIIAKNKKAGYNYSLDQAYEAGIQLRGTEIKSIRTGQCHITEAYVAIDPTLEVWIYNMYIAHWPFGNVNNHEENRKRKLLLNKKEIIDISNKANAGGYTLVPIKVYLKKNLAKLEIALGKGKKLHDKRQDQAKKDVERKLRQKNYD